MPTETHSRPDTTPSGASGKRLPAPRTRRRGPLPVLIIVCLCAAAAAVCLLAFTRGAPEAAAPSPTPEATPLPTPTAHPVSTVDTSTSPTPEPVPVEPYDFSAPAPESAAVEDDYFSDAVFLGDSRTDGLRLYSGLKGSHFLSYKGVTVFDVENPDKKVIELDGRKVNFMEALAVQSYAKVYIMLGVNELGYNNDDAFAKAYGALIDSVREIQPDAVIYVQSLVPVNPGKCRANNQPNYVTNEKIQDYTDLLIPLAEEKRVVYVDVAAGLVDEEGILPRELTGDGVHFTRSGYVQWLDYLKCHTVDADAYRAGQEAAAQPKEGANES